MRALRVERGEVLREPLADPLLVVVLPADRLSPPLMSELVREKKFRHARERRRIVAPIQLRERRGVVDDRKVRRAMPARNIVFEHRHRE